MVLQCPAVSPVTGIQCEKDEGHEGSHMIRQRHNPREIFEFWNSTIYAQFSSDEKFQVNG